MCRQVPMLAVPHAKPAPTRYYLLNIKLHQNPAAHLKSTPGKLCRVSSSACRLSHCEGPARGGGRAGPIAGVPDGSM